MRRRALLGGTAAVLGLLLAVAAAVLLTGRLWYVRFESCPSFEDEGRSVAPYSDQGWWCGRSGGDLTPDAVAPLLVVLLTGVLAVVLWRRLGVRGWVAGVVLVLVAPVPTHLALLIPPDRCSPAQLAEHGRGGCATDRESMLE